MGFHGFDFENKGTQALSLIHVYGCFSRPKTRQRIMGSFVDDGVKRVVFEKSGCVMGSFEADGAILGNKFITYYQ
jgi:hypothetical protein